MCSSDLTLSLNIILHAPKSFAGRVAAPRRVRINLNILTSHQALDSDLMNNIFVIVGRRGPSVRLTKTMLDRRPIGTSARPLGARLVIKGLVDHRAGFVIDNVRHLFLLFVQCIKILYRKPDLLSIVGIFFFVFGFALIQVFALNHFGFEGAVLSKQGIVRPVL